MEWSRLIPLKDAARENLIYSLDEQKVPNFAGVYVLGRRYGPNFEALYVGKANNIRGRLKGQLKNLPLMLHLQNARSGRRIALAARFIGRSGQQRERCLAILERALIRHFLSEGHDLVNKQGTRLRRHEVTSTGKHPKRFFPKLMYLDRAKGE